MKGTEWLTPQEVGLLCGGFTAQFIRQEIRDGQLRAVYNLSPRGKLGRFRIHRDDALAYLARLQHHAARA